MRVLHVVDTLGIGGTELGLANVIVRTDRRIRHIVCCVREGGATADRLQACGVPVTVLGKRSGNDWGLALRFSRICRAIAPDIVHTRNWGSVDAIVGARLAGVPVVIHGEHGRDLTDPEGTNRRRNRVRRVLSFFVDRMVAVSDQLARWLVDVVGIRESKVAVLKNGVDADQFRIRSERPALRASHGYSPEDVVVGTVGRLDPVKHHAAVLAMLSTLRSAHPQLRVLIAGDGPEREALAQAIERLHLQRSATLLGHCDDVPAVLSMMDVFVLPSLGEGMCNTLLEAMAVGLPVVATRVGGNPELVVDAVTGRLVTAGNAGMFAAAVASYADNESLRQDHGAAGRRRVLEHFRIEQMADRYLKLYESEVGEKRCAG